MALERRTGRCKDVIDHPPGGHDDLCNSAAGALVLAASAAGLVLGEIEPLKQLAEASIETYSTRWLRTIARRTNPAAQSVSEERRECSRCRGEMRAHPQNRDQFTCVSCGFCELISREVTRGVSCGDYLSQGSDRASRGFRSFDGFGGS